jgi:putative oxygen-independent coproporphyrinogen III oxidase
VSALPPLSLYIHIPWCVRKCPYCDFNSHALREPVDEDAYIAALLQDLEHDLPLSGGRDLGSIFIGGGTPSLFSGSAIERLLSGIRRVIGVVPDAEITLEANPGAVDIAHFEGYLAAGVNRLSIGVQSFDEQMLHKLGRIHSPAEAGQALMLAREAGFQNINLDLMFGLPEQDLSMAMLDLETAMALSPNHLSWYQLTIEPNTWFHAHPPPTPDDELLWEMLEAGQVRLRDAGYVQYEVSAYARGGDNCRHNLNYWTFGDYLGIGAGAHAKLTTANGVTRRWKQKHPAVYMDQLRNAQNVFEDQHLQASDLSLEFMMNALRLYQGVPSTLFEERTGLPLSAAQEGLDVAVEKGLLDQSGGLLRATDLGRNYLNDLLGLF